MTLDLRTFLVTVGNELGIGERLEQRLPEDAGQITILKSDQLDAAQTTLKVIKVLSWLVVFLAIAAFAGAIWLARDRRGMLTWVGVVLLLVGILLRRDPPRGRELPRRRAGGGGVDPGGRRLDLADRDEPAAADRLGARHLRDRDPHRLVARGAVPAWRGASAA